MSYTKGKRTYRASSKAELMRITTFLDSIEVEYSCDPATLTIRTLKTFYD